MTSTDTDRERARETLEEDACTNRIFGFCVDGVIPEWAAEQIDELHRQALAEARRGALETAKITALEQRCERTFTHDYTYKAGERTPWDLACTAIADAIGALASPAPDQGGADERE